MADSHTTAENAIINEPQDKHAHEAATTPTTHFTGSHPTVSDSTTEFDCTGYLGRLPPELRNNIYEMVFQPDLVEEESRVALLDSKPPPKALLSTCRQIHQETRKLYKAEYRKFWLESEFFIPAGTRATVLEDLEAVRAEDLEHVQHVIIRTKKHAFAIARTRCDYQLLPNQRSWLRNVMVDDIVSLTQSWFVYFTHARERDKSEFQYLFHPRPMSIVSAGMRERYLEGGLPFEYRTIGIKEEMKSVVDIVAKGSRNVDYGAWGKDLTA